MSFNVKINGSLVIELNTNELIKRDSVSSEILKTYKLDKVLVIGQKKSPVTFVTHHLTGDI